MGVLEGVVSVRITLLPLSAVLLASLWTSGCAGKADCNAVFYTFEQSPGEVVGTYRGEEFSSLLTVDLQANADGDQGTMTFTGEGAGIGDDDDSADGTRDYEDLVGIDTWQINLQWEDTQLAGRSTDGQYALKSSGSDCTTHGDKCFEAQMSLNGETDEERWLMGRLEIFDISGGLRGCMFLTTTSGDDTAELDMYWTP
jgi:hypothetical protein